MGDGPVIRTFPRRIISSRQRSRRLDRSVYSFCMCPGGRVIGCSAEAGGVITNGMSGFRRESPYANSAVVVNVRDEDLGGEGPLAGLAFRRHWEEKAFLAGGGDYCAPAQRLTDFMAGREGRSYRQNAVFFPGSGRRSCRDVLPPFVVDGPETGFWRIRTEDAGFHHRGGDADRRGDQDLFAGPDPPGRGRSERDHGGVFFPAARGRVTPGGSSVPPSTGSGRRSVSSSLWVVPVTGHRG